MILEAKIIIVLCSREGLFLALCWAKNYFLFSVKKILLFSIAGIIAKIGHERIIDPLSMH